MAKPVVKWAKLPLFAVAENWNSHPGALQPAIHLQLFLKQQAPSSVDAEQAIESGFDGYIET